jgi:hypothetical protein
MSNDIIAEVNEAMRQERMEKFWKENSKSLIAFVVLTIIATGVISAYRSWDANVKAAGTDKIMTLMEDKSFPDNIKDAKLDVRGGLRGIVLINGAQEYLNKKKTDEALALYAKAAEDTGIPGEMRDLAVLMQVRLTKDAAANDKLVKELAKIAGSNSPWQYHARIEAAALSAEKEDYKKARDYLAGVMDDKTVPESLYKKAQALDHVYALRQEKAAAAAKPEEKAGT